MKLSVVIPVFNEKDTIVGLLGKVQSAGIGNWEKEIIVVDDGSTDGTAELLKSLEDKYKIVLLDTNQGKGAALRSGFAAASGDYVIVQDADMEYDPSEYASLLEPVEKYSADAVFGSRFMGGGAHRVVYFWHYLGNKFLTLLCNAFSNLNLTDMETCYKLFRRELLDQVALKENRFGFEPEFTLKLSRLDKVKIFEVGVSYNGRTYSEGKKINWKDGFRSIYCIIKYGLVDRLSANQKNIIAILALATANLLVFKFLFGFHYNNDTEGFIWLIERFRGNDSVPLFPNRFLNPFYAVVGAYVFPFLSSVHSLILTNIIFYYGLVLLTYGLARRVFKNLLVGFLSAAFIMGSYAMLRYSLTQVQDIGGYFWFLLTFYASWRWWENKSLAWLLIGSSAVALGVLTKESGCMGALFFGLLALLADAGWKNKARNILLFAVLPFATIVINSFRGRLVNYNSAEWFVWNWQFYAKDFYTFGKWLGVNLSTYNLLWLAFFGGCFFLFKNWRNLDRNVKIYLLAAIPSSLSYFAWPMFISRTVFISAWLIVPIAAYGIDSIYKSGWRKFSYVAIVAIIIAPYVLQSALGYVHLFTIIESCRNNAGCIWESYRNQRSLNQI